MSLRPRDIVCVYADKLLAAGDVKVFRDYTDTNMSGSVCFGTGRALMTRENILRQIATLQTQLDEMDKTQGVAPN